MVTSRHTSPPGRRAGPGALALAAALLACACSLEMEHDFPGSRMVGRGQVETGWPVLPFKWKARFQGLDQRLKASPGGGWTLDFTVDVDLSRHEKRYGKFTHIIAAVRAERRYDDKGFFRSGSSTFSVSSNFTTTGVPMERFDSWPRFRLLHGKDGSPFEAVKSFPLEQGGLARKHTLRGKLQVKLPADISAGYWEPHFYMLVRVDGVAYPVHLGEYGFEWNGWFPPALPLVEVGSPAKPYMPWTILADYKVAGRAGTLPEEYRGKAQLLARSGFPSRLILPPARRTVHVGFPTLFPQGSTLPVDGGFAVIPEQLQHFISFESGQVKARLRGPDGETELGQRRVVDEPGHGPRLGNDGFQVDMTRTGEYRFTLEGTIRDAFGREFRGGGTYRVYSALPLTFSTSCKPGNSFPVGSIYPPKVNVLPPFSADVKVEVEHYPNSDPARKVTWLGQGRANRFGHYVTHDKPPYRFAEVGEYHSKVTARYRDVKGRLWMGQQTSTGVIADPADKTIVLHGARSFPYNREEKKRWNGAVKRFEGRPNVLSSFMLYSPFISQDPFPPYNSADTLFLSSNGSEENIIEPTFSVDVGDPELKRRLVKAHTLASGMISQFHQPYKEDWLYLKDVIRLSQDSFSWFPAKDPSLDELPVLTVGKDGLHGFTFPHKRRFQAYKVIGIVRPGFPVMTSAYQSEAIGLYWKASPNRFGYHLSSGFNGDLAGDVYRVQAGAVLKDLETGKNHYGLYNSSITVQSSDETDDTTSILGPGARPVTFAGGRPQKIFLAADTHDVLEVGEKMGFGGAVFPTIPAEVTWTVTKPSGRQILVKGRGTPMGVVGGKPLVDADEPGIYRVKVRVRHGKLRGDFPGTRDGRFWHCVVPRDNAELLRTTLGPVTRITGAEELRIPVTWPAGLKKVKLSYGVLMPGQLLAQGEVRPVKNSWEYPFDPVQVAVQYPNFDVRDFSTGEWKLGETVVFQFFLEAEDDQGQKQYDALRLALRRDKLFNYRAMKRAAPAGGHPHGVPGGPPTAEPPPPAPGTSASPHPPTHPHASKRPGSAPHPP